MVVRKPAAPAHPTNNEPLAAVAERVGASNPGVRKALQSAAEQKAYLRKKLGWPALKGA